MPGGEAQREMAFRLGINLAMYALCLDYKTDQVHVPFILRRRQWQSPERSPPSTCRDVRRVASRLALAVGARSGRRWRSCAAVIIVAWPGARCAMTSARRGAGSLALRVGAVLAALVLFFEPAVRLQNVTRLPNHVAMLVDRSESMRLADKAGEPKPRGARGARG